MKGNHEKQVFGLIGLGVMGQNFVLNVERNGFGVAVYNRTADTTKEYIQRGKKGQPNFKLGIDADTRIPNVLYDKC